MKLEAVDKRVPQLIRVATVEDVKDHMYVNKYLFLSKLINYLIVDYYFGT